MDIVSCEISYSMHVTGTFGHIYHGTVLWEDEDKESQEQEVVVKTVTGRSSREHGAG